MLLDNSLVAMGSGMSDGDRHNYRDLNVLLAGRGGGAVRPGRHLDFHGDVPLGNLWLSVLDAAGVPRDEFGDSTGLLPELAG